MDLILSDGQERIMQSLLVKKDKAIKMFENLTKQTNTDFTIKTKEFNKPKIVRRRTPPLPVFEEQTAKPVGKRQAESQITKGKSIKGGSIGGKIGGKTNRENGTGIFALTKEQRSVNAKKMLSEKWKCTETGYISNPSGLSKYQNRRGIDTTKRIRVE